MLKYGWWAIAHSALQVPSVLQEIGRTLNPDVQTVNKDMYLRLIRPKLGAQLPALIKMLVLCSTASEASNPNQGKKLTTQ